MFVSEFHRQIFPILGEKMTVKNKVQEYWSQKVPSVTIVQMQSMWTVGACPAEVSYCSQFSQEQGNSGLTRCARVFLLFLLCLFYDKCYSEGLLPFAHFSQLSIIPGPVNSGLVWTCCSYCSSDFHHGAGGWDGFKWLEGAVEQVGLILVPQSECLGSLNTFPFSVLMG